MILAHGNIEQFEKISYTPLKNLLSLLSYYYMQLKPVQKQTNLKEDDY